MPKPHALDTRALAAPHASPGPRMPLVGPVVQSANFTAASMAEWIATAEGDSEYTRNGNPTLTAVEHTLADLEEGAAGLVFGSGMAAVSATLLTLLKPGDHIVAHEQLFYGTYRLMHEWLTRLGIHVTFTDLSDLSSLPGAVRDGSTRVLYAETPTNPALGVLDLGALATFAHARGLVAVIDNTFATPYNQQPLLSGFDIVVHSATKYLAGHSDVICGAVVAADPAVGQRIKAARTAFGGVLDPHAAWLLHRGVKTLGVRMRQHNANALAIAEFLRGHAGIRDVRYPFLATDPDYALAVSQMRGGSGMVSFVPHGGPARAQQIMDKLRLVRRAGSLGGVESLANIPGLTSGRTLDEDARRRLQMTDDRIRLSVGIEHLEDLIDDLNQALQP